MEKVERYWSVNYVLKDKYQSCFRAVRAKGLVLDEKISYHTDVPYIITYEENYHKLLLLLFPELKEMVQTQELPSEDCASLIIYSGEANIFTLLPMLTSLYDKPQLFS